MRIEGNYFSSIFAKNSNVTVVWRAYRAGAAFASPSLTQFHPIALPISSPWQSETALISKSLRGDKRIWVLLNAQGQQKPGDIPEEERDYYLGRQYPTYGNLTPRDITSRAAHVQIRAGHGIGPARNFIYLDFRDVLVARGRQTLGVKYSDFFSMYKGSTEEDPYTWPMRTIPGAHLTMGGLWVDYRLQSTIPGLFVAGEANAAYHGANRLDMSSLLATCIDGAFTVPHVVTDCLSTRSKEPLIGVEDSTFRKALERTEKRIDRALSAADAMSVKDFHRELEELMYGPCDVTRSHKGLIRGIHDTRQIQAAFDEDVRITGTAYEFNRGLVEAIRVRDFLEPARLMHVDALHHEESCGAHSHVEHATTDGEIRRDDGEWRCVPAWESQGWGQTPSFPHRREDLAFYSVEVKARDYR